MKHSFLIILLFTVFSLQTVPAQNLSNAQDFVHPGVLHNKDDMQHISRLVSEKSEPAYGSFLLLMNHPCAQIDYKMRGPFRIISRDGEFGNTKSSMEADFSSAYLNTLMWICTGNEAHANKALDVLTAYADTLEIIPDTNDAPLLVGLEGFKIMYTLEALKYTYKGATEEKLSHISRMFKDIFIPVMERFYSRPPYTNGNWGPIVTKAYMAAAIYFNNRDMYDKAIDFYLNARDNGTIANYIDGETGQIQESGRDQPHCILGVGAMATVCEIAYKQGDDLYSALDNRLMKGYEYVAAYNLGYDVPYKQWTDITGKYSNWTVISTNGRGRHMPVFELAYNHYVNRLGLQMPFTLEKILKNRPEGYDRDQPGFGTLLFNNIQIK